MRYVDGLLEDASDTCERLRAVQVSGASAKRHGSSLVRRRRRRRTHTKEVWRVAGAMCCCVASLVHIAHGALPCHGVVCDAASPTEPGACFATGGNRNNVSSMDGIYVKPRAKPARLYDENCPFMARSREGVKGARYTCIHKAIETQLGHAWKPNGCTLAPIDGAVFARALGDRALWMIGDSLMWQNAIAMQCLLWRAGAVVGVRKPLQKLGAAKPDKPTPYMDCAHLKAPSKGRVCHVMTGETIDWIPNGRNMVRFLETYVSPNDIVFTNYGVWANSPAKLNAALKTIGMWYRSTKSKPTLIWRESSAQHFATRDGNYASNAKKKPCRMQSRALMVKGNWRNDVANEAMRELSVPVLPIWASTAFALLHRKKRNMNTADCTHFCNPGVPDVWAVMLYNHVVARHHD